MNPNRFAVRLGVITLLTVWSAACLNPPQTTPESTESPAPDYRTASGCYLGPVEVHVIYPDGSPAANVPASLGAMVWYSEEGLEPPPLHKSMRRTDAQGRLQREKWYECIFPTMFYALDQQRNLAGLRVCESMEELAEPQVVRLGPARWVEGRIVSSELAEHGLEPSYYSADMKAANPNSGRLLRYKCKSGEFRFLVPPGEYLLYLQGEHLEWRREIQVFVPRGEGTINLGDIELRAKGLVRLKGKPAPPWVVSQWLDGRSRTLQDYRGRYLLLCYWHVGSGKPHITLGRIMDLADRYGGETLSVVVIHPPIFSGIDALRDRLRTLEWSTPVAKELGPDPNRWGFPLGLDARWRGLSEGQTSHRYGGLTNGYFLIGPDGRVIVGAPSYDTTELDAALAKIAK
jgi:hypothetical protein